MQTTNPLFWQPQVDYLKKVLSQEYGNMLMVLFNYSIWYYLLFICFLVINRSPGALWQIAVATVIGEFIEKYGKDHRLWNRPLYNRKDQAPPGLVERWYKTGSFPSGHTIKAICFFFYTLQYQVFHPVVYLSIITPLLLFRVLVGFHYPVDILGGAIIGFLIWLVTHTIQAPQLLNDLVNLLFNFVFLR